MLRYWHEHNPWKDRIIYVPLTKIAECVTGETIRLINGSVVSYTPELALYHWFQTSEIRGTPGQLDGYILPQSDGHHSIGVRYGANPEDYFSPLNKNPDHTCKYLEEYRKENET